MSKRVVQNKTPRTSIQADLKKSFRTLIADPIYIHSTTWTFDYALEEIVSLDIRNFKRCFVHVVETKIKDEIKAVCTELQNREKNLYDNLSNGDKKTFLNYFNTKTLRELAKKLDPSKDVVSSVIETLCALKKSQVELGINWSKISKGQLPNEYIQQEDDLRIALTKLIEQEFGVQLGNLTVDQYKDLLQQNTNFKNAATSIANFLGSDSSNKHLNHFAIGNVAEPVLRNILSSALIENVTTYAEVVANKEQRGNTTDIVTTLTKNGAVFSFGVSVKTGKAQSNDSTLTDVFSASRTGNAENDSIDNDGILSRDCSGYWNELLYVIYNAKVRSKKNRPKVITQIFWLIQKLMGWKHLLSAALGKDYNLNSTVANDVPLFLVSMDDFIPMSDFLLAIRKINFDRIEEYLPLYSNQSSRFMAYSQTMSRTKEDTSAVEDYRTKTISRGKNKDQKIRVTVNASLYDRKKTYIKQQVHNKQFDNINYTNLKQQNLDIFRAMNDALKSDLGYSVSYRIRMDNLVNLRRT